jgi:hypothetical protein
VVGEILVEEEAAEEGEVGAVHGKAELVVGGVDLAGGGAMAVVGGGAREGDDAADGHLEDLRRGDEWGKGDGEPGEAGSHGEVVGVHDAVDDVVHCREPEARGDTLCVGAPPIHHIFRIAIQTSQTSSAAPTPRPILCAAFVDVIRKA